MYQNKDSSLKGGGFFVTGKILQFPCGIDGGHYFEPGITYRFDPPIRATGLPIGGPHVCIPSEMEFEEGWCMGPDKDDKTGKTYVFQGKPLNDIRPIEEKLRGCYFKVTYMPGSVAIPIQKVR